MLNRKMLNRKRWQATTAVLLTLGMNLSAVAPVMIPLVTATPAVAQSQRFGDVPSNHWAADFIEGLVDRNLIAGFPDGTFRPEAPVTRAQFASMIQAAYNRQQVRNSTTFVDVSVGHWAEGAIYQAYETGFMSGYPGNIFRPDNPIAREEVVLSLTNGLNYAPQAPADEVLDYYTDSREISNYARTPIAAATEQGMVVNYPSPSTLAPQRVATRAEVAAFLYQALASEGRVPAIASAYIASPTPIAVDYRIPAGTLIPVTYSEDKIVLLPEETLPVTFAVPNSITTRDGKVLIPAGSQVEGQLQPAGEGTQFVAETLIFPDGQSRSFNATSEVITETETIRKGASTGTVLKNAALGTAAAAAISAVTGDRAIATEELLIGAGAGALATLVGNFLGRNSVDVIVVEPETNLNLQLDEDFVTAVR
ncbi:MAG: S-layer homology domain-containing protein [Cyanobacteria bacterium P01_G01_bin.54]